MDAAVYLKRLKWLIPLIIIIGYTVTFSYFPGRTIEFAAYNVLPLLSIIILLYNIDFFDKRQSAVWVALVLFLMGYFVRFYWITIDPMPVERMLPWNPFRTMVADRGSLLTAFKLSSIAFSSFCIFVSIFLNILKKTPAVKIGNSGSDTELLGMNFYRLLMFATLGLIVVFNYLVYKYQIGEMGSTAGDPLPFRLKGFIFYAKTVCMPMMLIFCIYFLEEKRDFLGSRVGILILILNGTIDMFLRSSRSSLLLALLLLLFLVLIGGIRFRIKEKFALCLLIIVAFLLVPVMTEYRQIRLIENLDHIDAIKVLLNNGVGNWLLQFAQGVKFVLFRMPGIESLWCELALGARPLGIYSLNIFNSTNGIAGYLTHVIHPMKESNNTLLAPGFVGWLYMVGGLPIIIAGSFLVACIVVPIWNLCELAFKHSSGVVRVFILWVLFIALTEGTLDSMLHMIIAGIAFLAIAEFLLTRINSIMQRAGP